MKRLIFSAGLLVSGIIIGLGLPESIRAQVPGYVIKQIFKTDLVNLPGQEAIIYASEWPSGFRLPTRFCQASTTIGPPVAGFGGTGLLKFNVGTPTVSDRG